MIACSGAGGNSRREFNVIYGVAAQPTGEGACDYAIWECRLVSYA